jgi:hypothetical protein
LGNDIARISLITSIWDLRSDIKTKLNSTAYQRREGYDHEFPGFKDLWSKWKHIEKEIKGTLESLSVWLQYYTIKLLALAHKDEVVGPLENMLGRMTEHMKDSWVWKLDAGKPLHILYLIISCLGGNVRMNLSKTWALFPDDMCHRT